MTPDARLLIAPGCPHCGSVTEILTGLVKEGLIGQLEIINLSVHPEAAAEAGTRSVPWFRIGEYSFTGAHTVSEIRSWAEKAAQGEGWTAYYHDLLDNRQLEEAAASLKENPDRLCSLIASLDDKDLPMVVKIGIGAVLEDFEGEPSLLACTAELEKLTESEDPTTRADACHYLGLTGSKDILAIIRKLADDEDQHVREIVSDVLEELAGD
jgi:glutaredoxin